MTDIIILVVSIALLIPFVGYALEGLKSRK